MYRKDTMDLRDAIFYHLYPLGALGALERTRDDPASGPLRRLADWIPALERVGANALWLGPVFASEHHGYDTLDFLAVDPRLGTNDDLAEFSAALRERGIALVLDAVFNHVGRGHPIVREVVREGAASPKSRWIAGYDPSRREGGLPFGYEGWKGHFDLVKLDTSCPEVREHLVGTALRWREEFGIAGLRLDAADCMDRGFLRELSRRCKERDPAFFLIGEAVHGDHYRPLLEEGELDSVTDYEASKGLWSSCNDRNLFEISWTLDRLFGQDGICQGRPLYSFVDNHDVDRVASRLRESAHLYPLYGLLFSMPGAPSVYYGSEFGIPGRRAPGDDAPLRPALDPAKLARTAPHPDLARSIARFAAARKASRAAREGDYRRLHVEAEALVFLRTAGSDAALVAVNIASSPKRISLRDAGLAGRVLCDRLDPGRRIRFDGSGKGTVEIPPNWIRWLGPVA
jgi:cyclomaltodextrinase / maltogenic alpha-amylase / neopullulanase